MIDKNVLSFEDGLNINIGEASSYKITYGDYCEDCTETLFDLHWDEDSCLNYKLDIYSETEFKCDVTIDANLSVNENTFLYGDVEVDGDSIFNGDVTFNGDVNGIEVSCTSSNTILLYKDKSVPNYSILGVNGSDALPDMPYVASKKIKITKLKLLIGESKIEADDTFKINLYETELNGLVGYDANTSSITYISNINPNIINKLYEIDLDCANMNTDAYGNRRYRYVTLDVDIETTFVPAALIGEVQTSVKGIDDIFLWVKYNDIEE